jgi:hypothetical protein
MPIALLVELLVLDTMEGLLDFRQLPEVLHPRELEVNWLRSMRKRCSVRVQRPTHGSTWFRLLRLLLAEYQLLAEPNPLCVRASKHSAACRDKSLCLRRGRPKLIRFK